VGAATISGGALFVVYLATLAPDVTLWDSGEFLAAAHSLGVPHPPGTPLFVFVTRVWGAALPGVPFALAANALSALASAAAAGVVAWLVATWTSRPASAAVATFVGGTMAAVWQNATETEVYAHTLLLMALLLLVGHLAGVRGSMRYRHLLAFLFGLAVPLHLSALVAGPAAVILSATEKGGELSLRAMLTPAASWCVAVGIGTTSLVPVGAGLALLLVARFHPRVDPHSSRDEPRLPAVWMVLVGASFLVVLPLRARHDPWINEGNPVTAAATMDVVARAQYDVPPLLPRRAPLWLQLGNVVQYADWQVAVGMSDAPGPSSRRTPITLLFCTLAAVGAAWHARRDPRSFRATGLLFASATIGVVVMLNLRAGPSFGWGVLPDGALREARERDYFFAPAFLVAGVWSGLGIAAAASRLSPRLAPVVWLGAVVPLCLNWTAMNRRRLPDAELPLAFARSLLEPLPPRAVLVVAGDNDTFPLWYAQEVLSLRRDVTIVTIPLLGAGWYRSQLARRDSLLGPREVTEWMGAGKTLGLVGDRARGAARPVAVAVSVDRTSRLALSPGTGWSLHGMHFRPSSAAGGDDLIDAAESARVASLVGRLGAASERSVRPARDPAGRYVQRLMRCPPTAVERLRASAEGRDSLLESLCNFR